MIVALLASILLHGALFALALKVPRQDRPKPRFQPISLQVPPTGSSKSVPKPRPAAASAGWQRAARRAFSTAQLTPATNPLPGAAGETSAVGADEGTVPTGGGPRRLELFPATALSVPSAPQTPAARGLKQFVDEPWQERSDEARAARELDRGRTGLAPIEQRFSDWFTPNVAALVAGGSSRRHSAKPSAEQGLEAPAPLPALSELERVAKILDFRPTSSPKVFSPPAAARDSSGSSYLVSAGDTATLLDAVAVLVRVDHNDGGVPQTWRVLESSGDAQFDAAALAAVSAGLSHAAPQELQIDPKPLWSKWRFSAQLYRWQRDFDPTFEPPGLPVDAGPLSTTTVIREVKLVALVIRSDASTPGSESGSP